MNKFNENLSIEDKEFRRVLGNLEKVDVPNDFGFSVRAKIANKKENKNSLLGTFLKIATPISFALLIGFFVFFNYSKEIIQPNVANETTQENILENKNTSLNEIKTEKVIAGLDDSNITKNTESKPANISFKEPLKESKQQNENKIISNLSNKNNSKEETLTSVSAVTEAKKVIVPKGLNQNNKIEKPDANVVPASFEIEKVLGELGIEIVEANNNLTVKSIKKNSVAERSGLKSGDIVESLDNQKVSPKQTSRKVSNGNILTVSRDGKTIELKLQP